MKIREIRERTPEQVQALLQVWEASVRATHSFLTEAEILRIRAYVPQAIGGVEHLITAETEQGKAAGFMGVENGRLEMLFLSPDERGKGLGKQLVELGIRAYGVREVTVNEQNPQAVGFYTHIGFEPYRRTDCDEEGGPYPLLYMKLKEWQKGHF